jgi:hypothetical protein
MVKIIKMCETILAKKKLCTRTVVSQFYKELTSNLLPIFILEQAYLID